jgi:hypothetical protein
MLVTAHYKGHSAIALRVGRRNAQRFLARSATSIELELDHLNIACGLPTDFWQGEAEIRDHRLFAWLESKHRPPRPSQTQIHLAMVPSGANTFRLTLVH